MIIITQVDHADHRYPTTGDYEEVRPGVWSIRVTKMRDWRHWFLVGLHELVEMALTIKAGISEQEITAWDNLHSDEDEPGDNLSCPYRRQHAFALYIEEELCWAMGMSWSKHQRALDRLWKTKKTKTKKRQSKKNHKKTKAGKIVMAR